jgi:hypothetical protein
MVEWKSIETAPRDGTEIMAGQAGTGNVEFVRWIDGEWLDRTADPFDEATHWMPIPQPPARN